MPELSFELAIDAPRRGSTSRSTTGDRTGRDGARERAVRRRGGSPVLAFVVIATLGDLLVVAPPTHAALAHVANSARMQQHRAPAVAAVRLAPRVAPAKRVADVNAGSRVVLHGTIVAVDRRRRVVLLRHEALETTPAATRECRVRDPRELARLHPGQVIEAIAETKHQPWTLDRIEIREPVSLPTAPQSLPGGSGTSEPRGFGRPEGSGALA